MNINVIANPSFSKPLSVDASWIVDGWYPGNTVEWSANNGVGNSPCIKLTVPAQLGQSYVTQMKTLYPGNYTLSFYVKRTSGNVDVWCAVYANGSWTHGPSYSSTINSSYQKFSYSFTVQGSEPQMTMIRLIAGSVEGIAWFDEVELMAPANETSGEWFYADVTVNSAGLKVRETTSTSSATKVIGLAPNGRLMVLRSCGVQGWYECRWQNETGYVSEEFLENVRPIPVPDDKTSILLNVANQEMQADHNGNVDFYWYGGIDPDTDWCHLFTDWITAHCLWPDGKGGLLPRTANCGVGVRFFLDKKEFYFVNEDYKMNIYEDTKNETSGHMSQGELTPYERIYEPSIGDYVYFYRLGHPHETSYHVGIVIGVNSAGTTITTIEGNTDGNGVNTHVFSPDSAKCRFNSKILGFGNPGYVAG